MIFKDLRYIIKRIVIGVGIALLLMLIKGNFLLITNAKVLVDNNQLSYNNYVVLQQGSSQFHFYDDTIYQDISVFPQYFVLNMCTDSQAVNSWSVANNSLTNVNFYNTKISCTFPNSTYTGGHITYIYGQVNTATGCSVNGTSCYQNGYINFAVPNRSSWALLSYQLSKDSINIDYGSNTIINQNQMILSGQQSIINNQTQNTQDIINNNNSNSQSIINNNNQNTQEIIDNQNANTDKEIESQKVCREINIDKNSGIRNGYLGNNGSVGNSDNAVVTDFYDITNITDFIVLSPSVTSGQRYCFYDRDKTFISCHTTYGLSANSSLDVPNNAKFVRFTILIETNIPTFNLKFCKNGNQAIADSLNDDNVSSSIGTANNFFTNFSTNSHGLSGIITSPLRLVQTFTTATCNPLTFQLPFLHNSVTLPCMKSIIQNYFGIFFNLYQLITTGLISYHVLINIYSKIRDLQDPNKDRIEVLNL